VPFMRYVENYSRDREGTDENVIWSMRIACWVPTATNTQNMWYLLLFHRNNGCTNAPQFYVYKYIVCLVKLQFYRHSLTEYFCEFCVLQTTLIYTKDFWLLTQSFTLHPYLIFISGVTNLYRHSTQHLHDTILKLQHKSTC
jgi:hypothetical protein